MLDDKNQKGLNDDLANNSDAAKQQPEQQANEDSSEEYFSEIGQKSQIQEDQDQPSTIDQSMLED